MKKLALVLVLSLALATTSAAETQEPDLCNDISVRYTVFAMIARRFDTKAEYEAETYKSLAKSTANAETREILTKLIELAWLTRTDDIVEMATSLHTTCANQDRI